MVNSVLAEDVAEGCAAHVVSLCCGLSVNDAVPDDAAVVSVPSPAVVPAPNWMVLTLRSSSHCEANTLACTLATFVT